MRYRWNRTNTRSYLVDDDNKMIGSIIKQSESEYIVDSYLQEIPAHYFDSGKLENVEQKFVSYLIDKSKDLIEKYQDMRKILTDLKVYML